ncbi:MAG: hypothetical protein IKC69_00725 [Clostridia bacterium]|nr:hypothetical protein [Clostridia bacterium]
MKKLLALLLAIVMMLSLVACADDEWVDADDDDEESETTSEKKKKPTETVEVEIGEQVQTDGQNNDQGGTGTVITPGGSSPVVRPAPEAGALNQSFVSGKWKAYLPMEEEIRDVFDNDLDSYLDYDKMLMDGVLFYLYPDGRFIMDADRFIAQNSFEALLKTVVDAAEAYLKDHNTTFEEELEQTREEFTEELREEFGVNFTKENDGEGTWVLTGETLTLTIQNSPLTVDAEAVNSTRMILSRNGNPLFVCVKTGTLR